MKRIEIWPKQIVGGDAIVGDLAVQYVRLTDPEDELDIIVFIRPEALETLFEQIAAMRIRHAKPN